MTLTATATAPLYRRALSFQHEANLAFDHSELAALCALWRQKAQGKIPPRDAFSMRDLKPYLANLAILARDGDSYRFRLFGSQLTFLFGEHTGARLEEKVTPALLDRWLEFYHSLLAGEGPRRLHSHYRLPSGDYLEGESFAAPLADAAGEPRLAMIATFVDYNCAVPPPLV